MGETQPIDKNVTEMRSSKTFELEIRRLKASVLKIMGLMMLLVTTHSKSWLRNDLREANFQSL
jgi:hypothetical protein